MSYLSLTQKITWVVVADRLSLSLQKKSISSLIIQKLIHGIRILALSLLNHLAKESIKALYISRGPCFADCLDFGRQKLFVEFFYSTILLPFGTTLRVLYLALFLPVKEVPRNNQCYARVNISQCYV